MLATSAVWTPFIYAIHGIMDTIRSVDTIFNEIHGIMDTIRSGDTIFNEIHGIVGNIRSVDTIYLRHPRYYGHHPQCWHHF